jgi:hypothetical protein
MNTYNENLLYLLDKKGISITEFENIIYIPKVRIIEPTPDELVRISDYFDIAIFCKFTRFFQHLVPSFDFNQFFHTHVLIS